MIVLRRRFLAAVLALLHPLQELSKPVLQTTLIGISQ